MTTTVIQRIRSLLEMIAKTLVDLPEQVIVHVLSEEESIILQLQVADEDKGKVIGKRGRTALAIRIILDAIARKEKRRIRLEILE